MKNILAVIIVLLAGCSSNQPDLVTAPMGNQIAYNENKIKVLNVGSFHFGSTTDAIKVQFDETDTSNQAAVRQLSQWLAQFKPTIICLEFLPEYADKVNQRYQAYLRDPSQLDTLYGELSMVGFDVARLSGLTKVYGIDNHLGYNYSLGDFIEDSPELENAIDRQTYLQLTNEPFKYHPQLKDLNERFDQLSLIEKLRLINQPQMLDYSLNTNADKLFYVGIGDGFEGAEQAAQFYLRNMKIYSNLNRIKMSKHDRVLILMGAAHTAMLREFIERSPKFEMVNTLQYLQP